MEETSKIRVAVLESKYASLVDHGVPLSVSLQLQQLGLQLHQAQWTARHSFGGFSISFFWPALDSSKSRPPRKQKKVKKPKRKSTAISVSNQCTDTIMKPSDSNSQGISVDHSPVGAHHLHHATIRLHSQLCHSPEYLTI